MKITLRNIAMGSLFLIVFLLLIPQETHGLVLDKFKLAAENLATKTGPVASTFLLTFVFFVLGYVALFISTFLLQGIIATTPTALTVTTGEVSALIRLGWNFTTGIVNLILIIAFIIIAFAVIMGSEKIGLKKTLPKLIMVGLLVNFTLLFVGMGIDISNFLFNSIASQFFVDGGNLLFKSVTHLFELSTAQWVSTLAYLASTAIALTVPVVNIGVQIAWLVGLPFIFQPIINFVIYGGIMFMLSGVFFLYFLVFLIRIFVIQILAVLAPLAFFCLIFDETQKFWKQWLSALLQWLFVGVIFIFLMYFGLAMAPLITPLARNFATSPGIFGWLLGTVLSIVGEIALLAYFIVIVFIAKSFVPAAVNAVMSQAAGLAKMAAPWTGAIATGTARGIRNWEAKKSAENESAPAPTGWAARAQRWTSNQTSWAIRRAHNMAGTSVGAERQKDVKRELENFRNMGGDDGQEDIIEAFNSRLNLLKTEAQEIALLQYASEGGGKALEKMPVEQLNKLIKLTNSFGDTKTVKNVVKHISNAGDIDEAEAGVAAALTPEKKKVAEAKLALAHTIHDALREDINEDERVKSLKGDLDHLRTRLTTASNSTQRSIIEAAIRFKEKKLKEAGSAAINKIAAQALKTEDVEKLSDNTLKNENFLKALTQTKDFSFMRLIGGRKDGAKFMSILNNTTVGITQAQWNELKRVNPYLCNQIRNSPGAQAVYGEIHRRLSLPVGDPDRLI